MIWPSPTSSDRRSLSPAPRRLPPPPAPAASARLLAALLLAACPLAAAIFSGTVEVVNSHHDTVTRKKDFSGVVVWLDPVGRKPVLPAPKTYVMEQKGKRFVPHVLAIPLGSAVDFPNFDPIFHNAFSNFAGQPFDTGLYRPGASPRILFRRAGVVRVFCNIHSTMSAVIVVLQTPYWAVTGAGGRFSIPNVEPGDYRLHVWHERAAPAVLALLEKTLQLAEPGLAYPLIQVSESGWVQVPHKNKFGRDYGPEPSDTLYPGARK